MQLMGYTPRRWGGRGAGGALYPVGRGPLTLPYGHLLVSQMGTISKFYTAGNSSIDYPATDAGTGGKRWDGAYLTQYRHASATRQSKAVAS